jgi:hypothetical protein
MIGQHIQLSGLLATPRDATTLQWQGRAECRLGLNNRLGLNDRLEMNKQATGRVGVKWIELFESFVINYCFIQIFVFHIVEEDEWKLLTPRWTWAQNDQSKRTHSYILWNWRNIFVQQFYWQAVGRMEATTWLWGRIFTVFSYWLSTNWIAASIKRLPWHKSINQA